LCRDLLFHCSQESWIPLMPEPLHFLGCGSPK
jgi:hypothetical protein